MDSAFYVARDGRFVSSELTRGPWNPESQHAGPPAALIARELERCPSPVAEPPGGWQVGRVTIEILRAVPIAPLTVEARVLRPGRSVEMLGATLADEAGPVISASAWRVARTSQALPPGLASEDAVSSARRAKRLPPPVEASGKDLFPAAAQRGYHTAMDYSFISGAFLEQGPATVWIRMSVPLVEGEAPSPLQRVLIAADSGNGVSAALDWSKYVFINVDLSVHLHRMPAGEWVCLDAVTIPEPSGIGVSDSALHDQRGPIGRALQTLLVRAR